jgi:hypothetical protein
MRSKFAGIVASGRSQRYFDFVRTAIPAAIAYAPRSAAAHHALKVRSLTCMRNPSRSCVPRSSRRSYLIFKVRPRQRG